MTDEVKRYGPGDTGGMDGMAAPGDDAPGAPELQPYGGGLGGSLGGGMAVDVPLHPIAQALRATFHADNHATLGRDVTGLMLDLSHVPFEPHEFEPVLAPMPPPRRPAGWLERARLAVRRLRTRP